MYYVKLTGGTKNIVKKENIIDFDEGKKVMNL